MSFHPSFSVCTASIFCTQQDVPSPPVCAHLRRFPLGSSGSLWSCSFSSSSTTARKCIFLRAQHVHISSIVPDWLAPALPCPCLPPLLPPCFACPSTDNAPALHRNLTHLLFSTAICVSHVSVSGHHVVRLAAGLTAPVSQMVSVAASVTERNPLSQHSIRTIHANNH